MENKVLLHQFNGIQPMKTICNGK